MKHFLCDNDIVSQSSSEMPNLMSHQREMAHLSNEHLYVDAL
jgi:hypothetical protein